MFIFTFSHANLQHSASEFSHHLPNSLLISLSTYFKIITEKSSIRQNSSSQGQVSLGNEGYP